jgi:Protein of unknown function (DUF2829)
MNFPQAVDLLEQGLKVARQVESRKMFLFMTFGREIPLAEFVKFKNGNSEAIALARRMGIHQGDSVRIQNHIDCVHSDGSIEVGYIPTPADMEAEDWEELHF